MSEARLELFLTKMEEKSSQQQSQITDLLTIIQQMPGIGNPVNVTLQSAQPDAVAARADKIQRIAINLRKSSRIKDF